jgi:hypothetical protein
MTESESMEMPIQSNRRSEELNRKAAAGFCIFAATAFLAFWFVLLFMENPEIWGAMEGARKWLGHLFSPANPNLFYYLAMIIAPVVCLVSALLFLRQFNRTAFSLVAVNALSGFFIYDWAFAGLVAIPLLLAPKLLRGRSGQTENG